MNNSRKLAVLAFAAGLAGPAFAADIQPLASYAGGPFTVLSGQGEGASTYTHTAAAGAAFALDPHWTVTVQGAWTAGDALSDSIGDVAGVQGSFNSNDDLWLYQLAATYSFTGGAVTFGRVSSGDYFGALGVMGGFVNSAFSSNGAAISVNDPGRATAPASSWGITGQVAPAKAVTLKGGAFLSNPAHFTDGKDSFDFAFDSGKGVLGFVEADLALDPRWTLALGAYADSANVTTFSGATVRGNEGYYAAVDAKLSKAVEVFALVAAAPRQDRNLQPLSAVAGLVWTGPLASRPADALSLGVSSASFSGDSGVDGVETTLELNYLITFNDHLGVRPDLQYVIDPGGMDGDALVFGVQFEYGFGG
jgi:carbohydrate-selective porin OprB